MTPQDDAQECAEFDPSPWLPGGLWTWQEEPLDSNAGRQALEPSFAEYDAMCLDYLTQQGQSHLQLPPLSLEEIQVMLELPSGPELELLHLAASAQRHTHLNAQLCSQQTQPGNLAEAQTLLMVMDDGSYRCFDHGCDGRVFSCRQNYLRHARELRERIYCCACNTAFTRRSNLASHAKQRCKGPRGREQGRTDRRGAMTGEGSDLRGTMIAVEEDYGLSRSEAASTGAKDASPQRNLNSDSTLV